MFSAQRSRRLIFTAHARAKMAFYKLSQQRVLKVLHSPRRSEEGVAPKTVAAMQPGSVRSIRPGDRNDRNVRSGQKETWSQEIWVMFQDAPGERKIISAWRYPGVTKPQAAVTRQIMLSEYASYAVGEKNDKLDKVK
jgi:hypothetical protein